VQAAQGNEHGFVRDQYGNFTTFDAPDAVFGTFAYSEQSLGDPYGFGFNFRISSAKTPSAPKTKIGL